MAFTKKGSIHKSGDITIEAFDGNGIKIADIATGAAIGLSFETADSAIKVLTKLVKANEEATATPEVAVATEPKKAEVKNSAPKAAAKK